MELRKRVFHRSQWNKEDEVYYGFVTDRYNGASRSPLAYVPSKATVRCVRTRNAPIILTFADDLSVCFDEGTGVDFTSLTLELPTLHYNTVTNMRLVIFSIILHANQARFVCHGIS